MSIPVAAIQPLPAPLPQPPNAAGAVIASQARMLLAAEHFKAHGQLPAWAKADTATLARA